MARFQRRRVVKPEDIDMLGHVNNAVWVGFIAELAHAHASSLGFSMRKLREYGAIWIIRRHEIDYHQSALPDEELIEETWVESMKGARSQRNARFTRASDGELLVESKTTWAFVDSETLRPKRIHKDVLAAFAPE
ncbi:MAG: acyl-CoA thioesterase [bacterium]|nr:acyl-CoA thioesterase [bacterium]